MKSPNLIAICLLMLSQFVSATVDLNNNGMSDVWERKFLMVGAAPDADPDEDGQSNLQESLAGTNPNNINSVLAITLIKDRSSALFISWDTKAGVKYQVKSSSSMMAVTWSDFGMVVVGHGDRLTMAYTVPDDGQRFYRVEILNDYGSLINQSLQTITNDTDGDGLSDWGEIQAGYNPLDSNEHWGSPVLQFGSGTDLTWYSQLGKRYQIQSRIINPVGEWADSGPVYHGTGGDVTATSIASDNERRESRVVVSDVDSDGDGVSDWEEFEVGLDPKRTKTDILGGGDLMVIQARLSADSVVNVKAERAVANITRMEDGGFELTRTGGVDAIDVNYAVSGSAVAGSDYKALSGQVTIPFGMDSVVIPLTPLAGSTMDLSESVILSILDVGAYSLGPKFTQQVNVLKEVAINVKDHGAVGDGVADDTVAIQAALDALANSNDYNTIYFPDGVYQLNTVTYDSWVAVLTATTSYRILQFGHIELDGRDIVFDGDSNAVLHSTVSPTRAHMLFTKASFRSLSMRGMSFQKDSVPLSVKANREPNGSDGVSIYYADGRSIEFIDFVGCEFNNCHAAISITNPGYNYRGQIKKFRMKGCNVLNPHGANTVASENAWGGGQQVRISLYVDEAIYVDNYFDGGSQVDKLSAESPGGKLKDGSHFGSPNHLIFYNNTVTSMGVEAVYHTNDHTRIGSTKTEFLMPTDDGNATSTLEVSRENNTFVSGQLLNIRAPAGPGLSPQNNILEVVSFDQSSYLLTVKNNGHALNVPPGTTLGKYRAIYVQEETNATSIITNNFFDGSVPSEAFIPGAHTGIACNSRAIIKNNYMIGYGKSINMYDEVHTPLFPASRGSIISSNLLVTHDPRNYPVYTYGVQSWAKDLLVTDNTIIIPASSRCVGIADRGENANISGNNIIAHQVIVNGYRSSVRATGIAVGNTSVNAWIDLNRTHGFDVGVGVLDPGQVIYHKVPSHYSSSDVLGVDPKGVVAP